MSKGGRWPAVVETPEGVVEVSRVVRVDFARRKVLLPISPYDLSEGMPEVVESIAPESLAAMIFLTGAMVVIVGCAALELVPSWVVLVFGFICGLVARRLVGQKKN